MEERRRHNPPSDRNNVVLHEVELQATCENDEEKARENIENHRHNSIADTLALQFRHYRTKSGFLFITGLMLWSLFYLTIVGFQHFRSDASSMAFVDKRIDIDQYRTHPPVNKNIKHHVTAMPTSNTTNNATRITSAERSEYVILNAPNHDGFLHVQIQARDSLGYSRRSGGDFWFAILSYPGSVRPHPGSSQHHKGSTSGKIIDHHNGTYSVYFYTGWIMDTLTVDINITLANSNDATQYLRTVFWKTEGKTIWNGHFNPTRSSPHNSQISGGGVLSSRDDVSECTVRRNGPRTEECEYWFPQAMGQTVFVCHRPRNNVTCGSLRRIYYNFDASTRVTLNIAGRYLHMFQGSKYATRLLHGPLKVTLFPGNRDKTSKRAKSRPLCGPTHNTTTMFLDPRMSAGFWYNGNWTSFTCRSTHWRQKDVIGNCLRNRELTLSGDSTSRQWAIYFTGILENVPIQMFGNEYFKAQRYFPAFNFTLNFLFHPLVQTKLPQTFNDVIHTVQLLEDLRMSRGCNKSVVVISPWAHFLQWTRESFQELVELIRKAVDRFLRDCPRSLIVVKGPHARHARTREERLFGSNYTAFEWGEIMRSHFYDSGAWYLDVWDMNLSFMSKIDVHMPEAVVRQEVDMFLSYICRDKSVNMVK